MDLRVDQSPRTLVEQAARCDRQAFAALIRIYERTALAIAYAVVGDAALAGDVAQEAFLRVWQRIGELEDPDRFAPWLARIVRNLATDHLRRRPRGVLQDRDDSMLDFPSESNPSANLEQDDQRLRINAAIATLDELTRSAVVLKYYEGMSSRQIGELLDLSQGAVDMRLSRARNELREKLGMLSER